MSLYPSLEDMKIDQMMQAQFKQQPQYTTPQYPQIQSPQIQSAPYAMPTAPITESTITTPQSGNRSMYPSLSDYMGLELSHDIIAANMPALLSSPSNEIMQAQPNELVAGNMVGGLVAPLSGQSAGLRRAQVTNGIRQLTLCKDAKGQIGLRVRAINNGIFVCLVMNGSPAALAGLRFGDQILEVNNTLVAGFSMDQVHSLFKKSPVNGITVVVRDRPFERNAVLYKDSGNQVGFQFKNGAITKLVKDSSAARNGLLTEHQILEVNGQNVIGMKDKEITKIIDNGGKCITLTILPIFIYKHMIEKMAVKLLNDSMDHSIPAV